MSLKGVEHHNMQAKISELHWYSDWNGYEVGFDDVLVVGLYGSEKLDCDFYINVESSEVLRVLPREFDKEQ